MSPIQPGNPITEYSFEDVEHQKFELNVYVNGTFSPGVQIEFPRAKKFSLSLADAGGLGSDELPWSLILKWLLLCRSNHKRCNRTARRGRWYPTRLLDLRDPTGSNVKLIETAETPPDGPYISLSHRWDSTIVKLTTQDTLTAFLNGVEVSSLSKTFRDAIFVSRKLNVGYLWIDSLCIIQGSKDDWQREAGSMGHVYTNALCNLSALGSTVGNTGLLLPRNAELISPTIVELPWSDVPEGPYDLVSCEFWNFYVNDMPLNLRGWVLQERLLAARLIHFGSDQVFWECHELSACETYPEGIPEEILNVAPKYNLTEINPRRMPNAPERPLSFAGRWHDLVERYTKCALTMDEDKLIAISGIAKIFQSNLGDDYLAGLWRHDIVAGLLWYVIFGARRPDRYRAPSWSWASIDGAVAYSRLPDPISLITVVHAEVSLQSANTTGQVKDGEIRIRGDIHTGLSGFYTTEYAGWVQAIYNDSGEHIGTLRYDISPVSFDETTISWLTVADFERGGVKGIQGLCLECAGVGQGVYRRVGYFDIWYSEKYHPEVLTEEERRKFYLEEEDGVIKLI